MNLAYQSFQGLERHLPTGNIPEGCLFELIGCQEQRFQDLEDRVAGLHNQSMEVGDRLGDLETGCCCCRDVAVDSPPVSPESPRVSPSLSAAQGEGDEGTRVVENETPIPILVCGQQARRTVRFWFNPQPASSREGGIGLPEDPTTFRSSGCQGGGRSSRCRQRGGRL